MRNSDAMSVRKVTSNFIRSFNEPTPLGLLKPNG